MIAKSRRKLKTLLADMFGWLSKGFKDACIIALDRKCRVYEFRFSDKKSMDCWVSLNFES